MRLAGFLGAVALLAISGAGSAQAPTPLQSGSIPAPRIARPASGGVPTGEVVLLSDAAGWGATEQALSDQLNAKGVIVVGIDVPSWLAALEASPRGCVYLTGDIEALSHQIQRTSGGPDYLPPLVTGIGAGGALALGIAAQTPLATLGGTIAIDPAASIALRKPLCSRATATPSADGTTTTYGLQPGPVPDPVTIALTPGADAAGAAHARALQADHPDITISAMEGAQGDALVSLVTQAITAGDTADQDTPLGLPLSILEATPNRDTLAIIYSGDGGWRDLDRQIGGVFQSLGVPVVGLDSLRYFWNERAPQETADDLARIIGAYTEHWNVKHILLAGYSFGADILPATYNLLPEDAKAKVSQISLLALGREKPYQISVLGWLGQNSAGGDPSDDIKSIDPKLVQCFYGTEEEDDPCASLTRLGIETIGIKGGHHFDGDYEALAKRILAGLDKRLAP